MSKALKSILTVVSTFLVAFNLSAFAGESEAKKWVNDEFQPSTISKADQMKEMKWFINAAKPFKGIEINVLSDGIPTHTYESKT